MTGIRKIQLIGFIAILGFFLGCGPGIKQNAALDQARKAYADAQANPDIKTHAPVEMRDAGRSLEQAEAAKTDEETTRSAYLAKRQIELAQAKTDQKLTEIKAEALAKENQKVLLESRQREIEKTRLEAERLKKEAEDKAREVEKSRLEAEQLKRDAEAKAKEAEEARLLAEKAKAEAEKAKEEAKRLEQELSELQAKQTDRGIMLTIGDVLFATGKADLMPGAMRSIDKLSEFLHKYPKRHVLIEGHTDSRGSDELNLSLSTRRADAVRTALSARGIPYNRMTIKGYGKNYPIAGNETEAGRQQNRRVEIIILDDDVPVESVFR